ncbi:MAG: HAD hydrolase-like protein [Planctomycetota bacterium]|nr:HAD hydrolase-like protein [Planctomycetota bacterium]
MPATPFPFDAVIFDLDGTLVATDRFWSAAARAGARRAFGELGLERELPTAREWMSIVGLPLDVGFAGLFADLDEQTRGRVMAACVEEEENALRAGGAALIPGATEALTTLAKHGVKLGIASNCGQAYLDLMLADLGLARWIDEARCYDTPGMGGKAQMVEDLLDCFGTRSAVMVGDRSGDRDAAWDNGLPHVHLSRGYADIDEVLECEAVLDDLVELVPLLNGRATWIDGVLDELGFPSATAAAGDATAASATAASAASAAAGDAAADDGKGRRRGPGTIGITGPPGAGRTLWARDAERILRRRGVEARAVSLDWFRLPEAPAKGPGEEHLDDPLSGFWDLGTLFREILEPVARGEAVDFPGLPGCPAGATRIPAGGRVLLEGAYLSHPRLRVHLDRLVYLDVSEEVILRRVAGRDGRLFGPEELMRLRSRTLPLVRAFQAAHPPERTVDLVLEANSALGNSPSA